MPRVPLGPPAARQGPGLLYVLATPIGNLEDLTPRAARVLREADVIAAEDTRRVAKLLAHLGIAARVSSFHSYSTSGRLAELVEALRAGATVALVSDAGTPCISDPGAELVAAAWEVGARVVPVPGPCAVVAALSASGMSAGRFLFAGYAPRRAGERRAFLARMLDAPWPAVIYEAPGRAAALAEEIAAVGGPDRPVLIARELTKLHEEFLRGRAEDVARELAGRQVLGEVTVIVGPARETDAAKPPTPAELAAWLAREGLAPGRIAAALTSLFGIERADAYAAAQAARRGDQ
jgi:16S rRNA (cytidine1402-2'-O)-methyltransferase